MRSNESSAHCAPCAGKRDRLTEGSDCRAPSAATSAVNGLNHWWLGHYHQLPSWRFTLTSWFLERLNELFSRPNQLSNRWQTGPRQRLTTCTDTEERRGEVGRKTLSQPRKTHNGQWSKRLQTNSLSVFHHLQLTWEVFCPSCLHTQPYTFETSSKEPGFSLCHGSTNLVLVINFLC